MPLHRSYILPVNGSLMQPMPRQRQQQIGNSLQGKHVLPNLTNETNANHRHPQKDGSSASQTTCINGHATASATKNTATAKPTASTNLRSTSKPLRLGRRPERKSLELGMNTPLSGNLTRRRFESNGAGCSVDPPFGTLALTKSSPSQTGLGASAECNGRAP